MYFFDFIKILGNSIFDIILPHRCLACGEIVEKGGFVCPKCFEKIDFITEPCCNICGIAFDYADSDNITCLDCIQHKPQFDKARAAFLYENIGRDLALAFKYADRTEACEYFSNLMISAGYKFFNEQNVIIDYIIPVPIHKKKLLARKYNQSALLVKQIAKKTGLKPVYDVLIRSKNTKPQSNFHKKDRFKNVKGVFEVKNKDLIKDKNILLIDDVLTTGATVSECAKVMKKSGAKNIYVLALARTKV